MVIKEASSAVFFIQTIIIISMKRKVLININHNFHTSLKRWKGNNSVTPEAVVPSSVILSQLTTRNKNLCRRPVWVVPYVQRCRMIRSENDWLGGAEDKADEVRITALGNYTLALFLDMHLIIFIHNILNFWIKSPLKVELFWAHLEECHANHMEESARGEKNN